MYVIAKHQIKDTEAFFAVARTAAEGAPPDVHGRQFCPSRDGADAVCLWEADSLESVREYLDSLIEERRASPGTDFVSLLTQATLDGHGLSDDEVRKFTIVVLFAGVLRYFSVVKMLSSSMPVPTCGLAILKTLRSLSV